MNIQAEVNTFNEVKKIVFFGTPDVACHPLELLMNSKQLVYVVLVVTQAPARSSRRGDATKTPVHCFAEQNGIQVVFPETASDLDFIELLKSISADIFITAAYGNYLPQCLLNIPKLGTINIHPSLLPLYRGASPVQRSLENGDPKTGVTLLYSVKKMDAGPIIAQEEYHINNEIKAYELLELLFKVGSKLLLKTLPDIFANKVTPIEQNEVLATEAKKLRVEEGLLDFSLPALVLHNKVRAFAVWPTTKAQFYLGENLLEIKIITTRVVENSINLKPLEIGYTKHSLFICCGDSQLLEILELQIPGKKVVTARDFQNGLKGQTLIIPK